MKYIPNNFDFNSSRIIGTDNNIYEFDQLIGTGSQGKVFKYSNNNSSVVYKWFPEKQEESSTQFIGSDKAYKSFETESDYLKILTFYSKLTAFYKKIHSDEYDIKVIEDINKSSMNFLYDANLRINMDDIINTNCKISPLYINDAKYILDKNNNEYYPLSKPESKLCALYLQMGEGPFASLYSYEPGNTLENILKQKNLINHEELTINLLKSGILLHQYGILHRDIKPENIIIQNDKVIFLDFGIAQRFSPSDRVAELVNLLEYPTETHNIKMNKTCGYPSKNFFGSRIFNPPKENKFASINKDDVFSLGIISAILLTGKHPYMKKYCNSYNEFLNMDLSTQRNIKRDYAENKLMNIHDLLKDYDRFLEDNKNNYLLMQIKDLFHPIELKRTNRLSLIEKKLNLKIPKIPKIYENKELIEFIYYPTTYENKFLDKLKSEDELNFEDFTEFYNTPIRQMFKIQKIQKENKLIDKIKNLFEVFK